MPVTDWLLDSDPAIRWQVMADLTDAPTDAVAAERARIASTGWGARLLDLQDQNGQWGGGSYSPKWTSTTYTLLLLRHLGIDPTSPRMSQAAVSVRDKVTLGPTDQPFFAYRGETCITGMVLALGAYFGVDPPSSSAVATWLAKEQLEEGGWNCQTPNGSRRASFHTTISVLEGIAEYERMTGGDTDLALVRAAGEEYLLERRLLWRLSTGDEINPRWKLLSFPPRWHYDVLRALEHLRDVRREPDPRCQEAIAIVESKKRSDGRWPLQNPHTGQVHFPLEAGAGNPSRWNTLRASRVLRWFQGDQAR